MNNSISLVWHVLDVREIRPDLTDEECMHVLEMVKGKHDCSVGVSWQTLEIWAEELYPSEDYDDASDIKLEGDIK